MLAHYPIFLGCWNLRAGDLWEYVQTFPEHEVRLNHGFNGSMISIHQFTCGLVVELNWNRVYTKFQAFQSVNDLKKGMREEKIQFLGGRIKCYSNSDADLPSGEVKGLFEERYIGKRRSINESAYISLEYQVQGITVPDVLFKVLGEEIKNLAEFEKYCEKRKKHEKAK